MVFTTVVWKLSVGTKVKTLQPQTPDREWTSQSLGQRKWGIDGVVIACHDSHGLCYDVRHADGTCGHYASAELETMDLETQGTCAICGEPITVLVPDLPRGLVPNRLCSACQAKASAEQPWTTLPAGWEIRQLPLGITIRAADAPEYGGVRLFIQDGNTRRAARLVWENVAPEGEYPSACYLDYGAAQTLLESLLRCGVKPCGCCGERKAGG